MKEVRFEVKMNRREVKSLTDIYAGCTLELDGDNEPMLIKAFDSLDAAREELKRCRAQIDKFNGGYSVADVYIEENTYDEDGELVECGSVWDFAPIVIELVEKPSYDTLAIFDNGADAQKAFDEYDGDGEVFISFQ